MGRGHSGTRLVAWAIQKLGIRMGATEDVPTGDVQDRRFSRAIKRIAAATLEEPPTRPPRPRYVRALQRAVRRYLQWLDAASDPWGWKFPETYLIPHYVVAALPQARYVHVIRDGRDLAFKRHLTDDPRRRLGHRLLRHVGALDMPHHLQAALSWEFQVRRFEEFRAHTSARVYTIAFESLCRNPVDTMDGVCRFLDVPMTDLCRQYLTDKINPAKVGQYRFAAPRQIAEVESLIGPTLSQLGHTPRAA
jgi:hypothetical protein